MPRGTRPTPTAIRRITGQKPKSGRENPLEPELPAGLPPPPKHLTKKAKDAYIYLASVLDEAGVGTKADVAALTRAAELYAEVIELTLDIEANGRTYESETEHGIIIRPRPEVAMLADADRRFRPYLIEFGLTPASRTKVQVNGGNKPGKNKPKDDFFDS